MPHTPDTHVTITPKHVYINGEPISVMKDTLELSNPSPVEIQTVTLTIIPTSVTILNDDDSKVINAVHEAVEHRTRDEVDDDYSAFNHITELVDILDAQKRRADDRMPH